MDCKNNDFIEKCRNVDFSVESKNKDINLEILKKAMFKFQNEGDVTMKRIRKPFTVMIVATAVLICLSITVYGQSIATALKSIFIGNNAQYDFIADGLPESPHLPAELENYTETAPAWKKLDFYDLAEGLSYFTSEVHVPGYLPEGYGFEKISFTDNCLDENSKTKIMDIFYSNGGNGSILCMVRFMDEETAFTSKRGCEPEEIFINGNNAAIIGFSLHIKIGDVLYEFIPGSADISIDELLKIAESLG